MPHLVWLGFDFNNKETKRTQVMSFIKMIFLPEIKNLYEEGCTILPDDENSFLNGRYPKVHLIFLV